MDIMITEAEERRAMMRFTKESRGFPLKISISGTKIHRVSSGKNTWIIEYRGICVN